MDKITIVFTTRHRKEDAVEKDCYLIADCIKAFTYRYKFIFNGTNLIVFHVDGTNKDIRQKILFTIIGSLQNDANFKSLDLQSYTFDYEYF